MTNNITPKIVFSLLFDANNEFQESKGSFVQFFLMVQFTPESKGHLRPFELFLTIFVKSKKRASVPSLENDKKILRSNTKNTYF